MRLKNNFIISLFILPLVVFADGVLTLPDVYPFPFSIKKVEVEVTINENIATPKNRTGYVVMSDAFACT